MGLIFAALAAFLLYYSRSLSPLDLNGALEPAVIDVSIQRFGADYKGNESRSFQLEASSPQGSALLEELNGLRLRRSPLNPLRELHARFFTTSITGRQTHPGEYNYVIHIFGKNGGWIGLQFFIDQWGYDTPKNANYLPCFVSDGQAAGQTLGDKLWDLAAKSNAIPY